MALNHVRHNNCTPAVPPPLSCRIISKNLIGNTYNASYKTKFQSGDQKMPFCHRCGSSTEAGDVFCAFCGASLKDVAMVTPQSALSSPANSPAAPPAPPSARPEEEWVPSTAGITFSPVKVAGIIGIILIIAAVAIFFLFLLPKSAIIPGNTSATQDSGNLPVIGGCSAGMSQCSGKCVDLQTDSDNCGACGFSVPYGESCRNGQFSSQSGQNNSGPAPAPTGTTVPSPKSTTIIQSASTSTTTAASKTSCMSGLTLCSGTCRDLLTDSRNCGACGYTCPSGLTCQNAWCLEPGTKGNGMSTSTAITISTDLSCSGRETLCGRACTDLLSDKKNCGICGRTCGNQQICVNARCGPACTQSGTSLCDDKCVDLETDNNNCGVCGTECPTFLSNSMGSGCTYGKCVISQCKTNYGDCNEILSDGCEANLLLDASNCGSCGKKCPSGEVCYNKKCMKPYGT
jgi:hypothetical protein